MIYNVQTLFTLLNRVPSGKFNWVKDLRLFCNKCKREKIAAFASRHRKEELENRKEEKDKRLHPVKCCIAARHADLTG